MFHSSVESVLGSVWESVSKICRFSGDGNCLQYPNIRVPLEYTSEFFNVLEASRKDSLVHYFAKMFLFLGCYVVAL